MLWARITGDTAVRPGSPADIVQPKPHWTTSATSALQRGAASGLHGQGSRCCREGQQWSWEQDVESRRCDNASGVNGPLGGGHHAHFGRERCKNVKCGSALKARWNLSAPMVRQVLISVELGQDNEKLGDDGL